MSMENLPQLIALANLLENHQIDEHAVRLQAEAVQLAKIQYLQCLLQSAANITTTPYDQNSITDMEALNLLNSIPAIKENPVLNSSQTGNSPASFSQLGIATSQPLHHQVYYLTCASDNPPDSSWLLPSPPTILPSLTDHDQTSMSNPGDASSTSSYGGGTSSFWPELYFEDPIMQEIS
ncbi:hypothetical protein JRO89_XS07G0140300 [Xanthoceras sorbifolium]|uniref:Uncharacterized protein n=1 Tax=Xanthoceras sorbifolium TaxID=99658 RepID=A0ABQ8HTP7_9ROSI|nr:hypothetical protein JRO89_XS07G0140300 [Xanthoceras sorbifolium]